MNSLDSAPRDDRPPIEQIVAGKPDPGTPAIFRFLESERSGGDSGANFDD